MGLGSTFLNAVATAFERIAADPRLHPRLEYWTAERDVRRHCLKQYPCVLIFWVRVDGVVVVAVSHGRRQPMYWIDRMAAPE
ncbi:MAG: type II toxin-antitoxin system RelE/ParE family toxin [Planctomycetaceae bacterium]